MAAMIFQSGPDSGTASPGLAPGGGKPFCRTDCTGSHALQPPIPRRTVSVLAGQNPIWGRYFRFPLWSERHIPSGSSESRIPMRRHGICHGDDRPFCRCRFFCYTGSSLFAKGPAPASGTFAHHPGWISAFAADIVLEKAILAFIYKNV